MHFSEREKATAMNQRLSANSSLSLCQLSRQENLCTLP
jgi:hypothetical protein